MFYLIFVFVQLTGLQHIKQSTYFRIELTVFKKIKHNICVENQKVVGGSAHTF